VETYGDKLRALADMLADLADKPAVVVVAQLGALSDRSGSDSFERLITDARREAAIVAMDEVGGQSALARLLGVKRQAVSQLVRVSRRARPAA
jgi:Bacterial toxin YdaS